MSRGDWLRDIAVGLIVLALVLVAAFGVLWLGDLGAQNAQTSNQAEQEEDRTESLMRFCAALNSDAEPNAADKCEHARQYADLDAQRSMAKWAERQAGISLAGLAGLTATVYLAWLAWRAAQSQAITARQTFEELERPHLFIEVIDHGAERHFWGTRVQRPIKFVFRNLGRTPARLHLLCRRHHVSKNGAFPDPRDLYPDSVDLIPEGAVIAQNQINETSFEAKPLDFVDAASVDAMGKDWWFFTGFLIYRGSGSQEYVTGFCFRLNPDVGKFALANPPIATGKNPEHYNYGRSLAKNWMQNLSRNRHPSIAD